VTTGVGVLVGIVAAAALRHAYDPAASGSSLDLNGLESVVVVLAGGLFLGPAVAMLLRWEGILAAVVLAAIVGGPALATLLAVTVDGSAAGGADRFLGWTLVVAAVYAFAGAVTTPGTGRRSIIGTALAVTVAGTAVATLELHSQARWRTWDVAHHGVALVLPDLPGFEPTGMRFYTAGIHVEMSGNGGTLRVDLLNGSASRARMCDSDTCWNRPGDRSLSYSSTVTIRHGDRLVQISPQEGASFDVALAVPLRPVTAEKLTRLPKLPALNSD
jgi:hypothetical protein